MSPTNAHSATRGFTLIELMIAMSISAVVFAAILSGYIFMARNLTRLMSFQQQDVQSRRVLYYLTKDVGSASSVSTAATQSMVLTVPNGTGTATVSYTYTPANGTLTRSDSSNTITLATDLDSFSFSYFNNSGVSASDSLSIKQVELSFSSEVGSASNGTANTYTMVSPRLLLRNKSLLE